MPIMERTSAISTPWKKSLPISLDPPFSRTPGDQRLQPGIQPLPDDSKQEVIDTGDSCRRQRIAVFIEMAQKDIIGNEIDLRHQYRQADGEGHAQYIPVADGDPVSFGDCHARIYRRL